MLFCPSARYSRTLPELTTLVHRNHRAESDRSLHHGVYSFVSDVSSQLAGWTAVARPTECFVGLLQGIFLHHALDIFQLCKLNGLFRVHRMPAGPAVDG